MARVTKPKTIADNEIVGAGQHSHPVPTAVGVVVEIRDGNHEGTAVWRRDGGDFGFASFDHASFQIAERCVLVCGQDVAQLNAPFGCDLEAPRGLALVGVDSDDDLSWLSEGAELLWDSAGSVIVVARAPEAANAPKVESAPSKTATPPPTTPKDRKLALAEAVDVLRARRDPHDSTRWVYRASEDDDSWWSVTESALLRFVELRDAKLQARPDRPEAAAQKAYDEWAENDTTAVRLGRRL